MTSFYDASPVVSDRNFNKSIAHLSLSLNNNDKLSQALKATRKSHKINSKKHLKKKLKKYKLRHDGKEDNDVLIVSDIFNASLIIKSPNSKKQNIKQNHIEDIQFIRPKNYLFKMGWQSAKNDTARSSNKLKESSPMNETVNDSLFKNQGESQTNAFQLLMDSRNKVIGCNSPGKEKSTEAADNNELIEKRGLKNKRLLILKKMAESKGALKKIELEEFKDNHIKIKMEKRAEKLKNMILNNGTKITKGKKSQKEESDKQSQINETAEEKHPKVKALDTLHLVNIINECEMRMNISPERKQIPNEDKEFLKKLSPSLKKKENMLSYFQKIEKTADSLSEECKNDSILIKVKLKAKKKIKTQKTKRKRSPDSISTDSNNITKQESKKGLNNISNDILHKEKFKNLMTDSSTQVTKEINKERPKRSVKRPVKYVDDYNLSSSDEDLTIFTFKKKKTESSDIVLSTKKTKESTNKKTVLKEESLKKTVKLAPIFNTKIQPSLADIDAKQKFLQSGVPEQLKRINSKQKVACLLSTCFPVTIHVQQCNVNSENIQQTCNLSLTEISIDTGISQHYDGLLSSFIDLSKMEAVEKYITYSYPNVKATLQTMKELHPRFPIYRTYRLLKDKSKGVITENTLSHLDNSMEVMNDFVDFCNESLDKLNWTSKYKATSSNQIIGNFESIKELRKWLIQWTENQAKIKLNNKDDSDSSDFYLSDTDSRDSIKAANNLLIITGPVGCGKTSGVYAVAAELAIKVLEVNASSKRTGKIMLQDLHEATQSHKVNRATNIGENSQKSQEILTQQKKSHTTKKRGRPKKSKVEQPPQNCPVSKCENISDIQASQDATRTAMSLILIDDADIVFEQDDGFCSAIVQLVQCSKRPVILITSTLTCQHLQRFLQNSKIIKFNPLLPTMLGSWIDLLCLANNGISWPGLGEKFLNYFRGDIRKTINYLQFYTQIEDQTKDSIVASQQVELSNEQFDEEKSNMSWLDYTEHVDFSSNLDLNKVWTSFTNQKFDLVQSKIPVNLLNVWWSIPRMLIREKTDELLNEEKIAVKNKNKCFIEKQKNNSNKLNEIGLLANAIDAISRSDCFNMKRTENVSLFNHPWFTTETHSVSEEDNIENYTRAYDLADEISHEYVKSTVLLALKNKKLENPNTLPLEFPGMSTQRSEHRVVTRHKNLNCCLNTSATLDRRALALDYWSSCRTICRIEKTKSDSNTKRNNRYCHYLKSMNANCTVSIFDNLADSLQF